MNIGRKKHLMVFIFSFVFFTTLAFSTNSLSAKSIHTEFAQGSNPKRHTVKQDETIYSISRLYGVSVDDIYALNPHVKNGIKIGDVLNVDLQKQKRKEPVSYTVKPKETLYSISKQFDVSLEDLVKANPVLKDKALSEGQTIVIPVDKKGAKSSSAPVEAKSQSAFLEHEVAPKETIYGIAKQYNTTPEALIDFNPALKDGLRQGMKVLIPVIQNVASTSLGNNNQNVPQSTLRDIDAINIGLVLPFVNKSAGRSARFVEYYEGFLLALQEMKAKGFSANVYVFDMGSETGTTKLKSLLDTYEMKNLDLIIGGISSQQIDMIADFTKRQGIRYGLPFPTKENETLDNPQVFQVNAPHSILYRNVAKSFVNKFNNCHVIYLSESGIESDKKDFVNVLNVQLNEKGMKSSNVTLSGNVANLSLALDRTRQNIIIPTSSSAKLLQVLLPILGSLDAGSTNVSLFGYPEWQTYSPLLPEYHKYNTYIFSSFYLSEEDYKTHAFIESYKKWYNNKSLINTYPKYGVLGYDTGMYFLTGLLKYGKNFESALNYVSLPELQSPLRFDKENVHSGYVNNGFYMVHYMSNGSVSKIEYGK